MFINKDLDKELTELIENKNWSDYFNNDPAYSADPKTFHTKLYDDITANAEQMINDILAPFYRNNYVVKLATPTMKNGWWYDPKSETSLISIEYNIKFSDDSKTNPFECSIPFSVKKNGSNVEFEWRIKNPERIYIKRYLHSGNHVCCNQKLFTNRGFTSCGWQEYKFFKQLNEWSDEGGFGDNICKYLKKTITTMKTEYEQVQKNIKQKKNELSIQLDDVSCMLEEINAQIKDTKLRAMFDGECSFDYVDSPIKFAITFTNNPEQKDENLYVNNDLDVILGDRWHNSNEDRKWKQLMDENEIQLYSYGFNRSCYSYRQRMNIELIYRPNEAQPWDLKFENWNVNDEVFKKLFKSEMVAQFGTIEKVKEYILNVILKDHELYNKMMEWIK